MWTDNPICGVLRIRENGGGLLACSHFFLFCFFYFLFTIGWWSFEMTQTKSLLVSLRLSVQRTTMWCCSTLVFNNGSQSKFSVLVSLIFRGWYCLNWWSCNTQRDAQWSSGFWCIRWYSTTVYWWVQTHALVRLWFSISSSYIRLSWWWAYVYSRGWWR